MMNIYYELIKMKVYQSKDSKNTIFVEMIFINKVNGILNYI